MYNTMKQAVRAEHKIRGAIELLNHGAGDFSANGTSVKIWSNGQQFSCNWETAKLNDMHMVR